MMRSRYTSLDRHSLAPHEEAGHMDVTDLPAVSVSAAGTQVVPNTLTRVSMLYRRGLQLPYHAISRCTSTSGN